LNKTVQAKEQLEKAKGEVNKRLEEAQNEKEVIEKKIIELEKKTSSRSEKHSVQDQEELNKLAQELEKVKEEAHGKDREIEELKKELEEKTTRLEEATKELEEKEKSIKALKTRIGIMSEKVDESERGAKDFESLKGTLREMADRLTLSTRQDTSPKAMTALLVEVKMKLQELDNKFDKEKDKESNLRKKLDKAQGELVATKESVQLYKKELEDTQRECSNKIERLEKVNKDLEAFLRQSQDKAAEAERETEYVRGNLTKTLQTLELEKEGFKKEIEGYKKTLADMNKDQGAANETLVARFGEVETEKKQLEQELWNSRTEIHRVEREVENMRKELERSREFFEQERRRLEARIEEEQEEVRRAKESVKKASVEREEWITREFGSESPAKQRNERAQMLKNVPRFDDVEYVEREIEIEKESQPDNDGWVTRDRNDDSKVKESAQIARNIEENVVNTNYNSAPVEENNDGWVTRDFESDVKIREAAPITRPKDQEERIKIARNLPPAEDEGNNTEENNQKNSAPMVDEDGWVIRDAEETTIVRENVIEVVRPKEERVRVAKNVPIWDPEDETCYVKEKVVEIVKEKPEEKSGRAKKNLYINIEENTLQEENQRLIYALRQIEEERDILRKRLLDIDAFYTQKLDELSQELSKKDEHIKALSYDVTQMKDWIVERHGDDVFEKPDHEKVEQIPEENIQHLQSNHNQGPGSGNISAALSVSEGREELSKSITILLPQNQPQDEWTQHHGILKSPDRSNKSKLSSDQKKKNKNFSLSWKAPKDHELLPKRKERGAGSLSGVIISSLSATPKSVKYSDRGSVGTSDSRREKKPEAAYQQLERMILDLNERLANADKRARAECNVKLEEAAKASAEKEDKLLEEIAKIKEEKKELEKRLEDIEWTHAVEMNNLMKKSMELDGDKTPVTPMNDAGQKEGEGKKKKKKKNK